MWKLLLLAVARLAHAECPNWCSQMGICSGPGSDAHCICNPGHTGDDCSLLHCPRGPDWRAEGNASRQAQAWVTDLAHSIKLLIGGASCLLQRLDLLGQGLMFSSLFLVLLSSHLRHDALGRQLDHDDATAEHEGTKCRRDQQRSEATRMRTAAPM